MKKILSLVLAVLMTATIMCGCTEEHSVQVSKSGKTKITIFAAIPVELVEEMEEQMGEVDDDLQLEDSEDIGLEEDYTQQLEDMEIKKVNGEECYVSEETLSFSSTTKANKHMMETYGEDVDGYFKKFKVTTKSFSATTVDNLAEIIQASGVPFTLKLNITLPYLITKTNGELSDDKKTVTFDLSDTQKVYAYTTQSANSNEVFFVKNYLKSNDSVYLDWNSVKGATKYTVQYKATSDSKWKSVSTTKTAKTITGLKVGKKYAFKVTAVTKSKKYTSISTYETTLKKVSATVKSTTAKTAKLSWKRNSYSDGYIIYQKTSKTGTWKAAKMIKDPYTTSYTLKGLTSKKKYYFKVVSYSNENGKRVKSSGDTATITIK